MQSADERTAAEHRQRTQLLAYALGDFRRFCGLLEIVPKSGPKCRLVLNEIQRRYCQERTQRDAVLKPRQIGFTTMEQARDVFHFLTVPGARVVVTCQSAIDNQPKKLLSANYRLMFEALQRAGLQLNFHTATNTRWILAGRDSTLTIIEAGASEASANKKGRAGTVTRLHLTETAFYDYADNTLNALLESVPSVEHGSEIVSESTANGAAGFFYRQCKAAEAGSNGYRLHFYPWYEAAEYSAELEPGEQIEPQSDREKLLVSRGVTAEQLKWYRRKVADKGQDQVDQEYPSDPETCFLTSGRTFFDQGVNKTLLESAPPEPLEKRLNDKLWIWKLPVPGRGYVIGGDTSEGTGLDDSAAPILDWETGEHVATLLMNVEPIEYAVALATAGYLYNTALVAVERNNHGHSVLQALVHPPPDANGQPQASYPCLYTAADGKLGWLTSPVTRPVMLDNFAEAHRKGFFKTPDRRLLQQLKTFVTGANGKPQAASGEKDDLVLGGAIGWEVRLRGGWVPPKTEEEIEPYERQW